MPDAGDRYSLAFGRAVEFVLSHEGGYVDDVADPGGRTKYGISQRSYPDLDIANLTRDDAKRIYWRDYWRPLRLDSVVIAAGSGLALMVFDGAVNAGLSRSVRWLQHAHNDVVPDVDAAIVVDGVLGDKTLAALSNLRKSVSSNALCMAYVIRRGSHYIGLLERTDWARRFIRGWLSRQWAGVVEVID